jgi:ABC-type uncharacterized transport system ATPase subunit
VGENGAGKSTLMGILYGYHRPDRGEILVRGRPVVFRSPQDALGVGIGMVHQHFMLVEPFTVLDNVVLGVGSPGHEPAPSSRAWGANTTSRSIRTRAWRISGWVSVSVSRYSRPSTAAPRS